MDEAFAAMADIEQRHRLLVKSYTRQIARAERILGEIRDPEKRSLARLIYLDGVADIRARERLGLSRGEFERLRRELEAGIWIRIRIGLRAHLHSPVFPCFPCYASDCHCNHLYSFACRCFHRNAKAFHRHPFSALFRRLRSYVRFSVPGTCSSWLLRSDGRSTREGTDTACPQIHTELPNLHSPTSKWPQQPSCPSDSPSAETADS